jgi:hypothetical protein
MANYATAEKSDVKVRESCRDRHAADAAKLRTRRAEHQASRIQPHRLSLAASQLLALPQQLL